MYFVWYHFILIIKFINEIEKHTETFRDYLFITHFFVQIVNTFINFLLVFKKAETIILKIEFHIYKMVI